MLEFKKITDEFNRLKSQYEDLTAAYSGDSALSELENLKTFTLQENFWDDRINAENILKKISSIESEINDWRVLDDSFEEICLFNSMIESDPDLHEEFEKSLLNFKIIVDKMELLNLLNSPEDKEDAILTIHSGAGGTDAQDWANMIYRMYARWCETNDYSFNILSFQEGDEAGIKEVSMEIKGLYSYGYLKSEIGIHRLVRISPFNSNAKRHTSFASVFVSPIIDDDINIEIKDKDVKIDTYRASGAGGQHVNKTDSAVRITHIPTNIVVQCQNQRSQLNNKNNAMKMLKSKLYQLYIDDIQNKKDDLFSEKKDISWGSQIRSYVFHPYSMVKDHRTKYETANVSKVMDGDLNIFIRSYLLNQMEIKNA